MALILNCDVCKKPISISTAPVYFNDEPIHSKCARSSTSQITSNQSSNDSDLLGIKGMTYAHSEVVLEIFHYRKPSSAGTSIESRTPVKELYSLLNTWMMLPYNQKNYRNKTLRVYLTEFSIIDQEPLKQLLGTWVAAFAPTIQYELVQ